MSRAFVLFLKVWWLVPTVVGFLPVDGVAGDDFYVTGGWRVEAPPAVTPCAVSGRVQLLCA